MNGGKSRSEVIQSGDKSRPQSNTWNPFAFSTEAFTAETMQSMLPQNVQGGEWQSRAIAMNKALVFGTKFWCVREGKTMSLQMLREHMTLEGMAKLYCRGLDDQWPEEAIAPLRNYLQDVPGFDMSLVRTPSAWTEEPRKQHAYLSGQFSETFTTFAETFGDVFAADLRRHRYSRQYSQRPHSDCDDPCTGHIGSYHVGTRSYVRHPAEHAPRP